MPKMCRLLVKYNIQKMQERGSDYAPKIMYKNMIVYKTAITETNYEIAHNKKRRFDDQYIYNQLVFWRLVSLYKLHPLTEEFANILNNKKWRINYK